MFRGCVALAYPGQWDQGLDPETQTIPAREELIPQDGVGGVPRPTDRGIIDFDMNDRNIMIGDYDSDVTDPANPHPHDQVPVIKIGDLGAIRALRTERHRNSVHALVACRVCGNRWCNTPEQFTQSWNNYGPEDLDLIQRDETAGQYDWWTNLWMAAQLMNIIVSPEVASYIRYGCLVGPFCGRTEEWIYRLSMSRQSVDAESCYQITQWKPDIPPECVQVVITKPTIPPITHQVFTYGSHLLLNDEFSYYDTSLRATVAWCMAHRPRDRPTMLEIQDIFRRALVQVYQGDDDDDRSSIRELLETPPPSPSSVPSQD